MLPVGKTEDFKLTHCDFRTFTPEGEAPTTGWPVFIYFHGGENTIYVAESTLITDAIGGWTFGNINSENSLATNMCVR